MPTPVKQLMDAGETILPMEIGSIIGGGLGGLVTAGNPIGWIGGATLGAGLGGIVAHHNVTEKSRKRYERLLKLQAAGHKLSLEQLRFVHNMQPETEKAAAYLAGRLTALHRAGLLR